MPQSSIQSLNHIEQTALWAREIYQETKETSDEDIEPDELMRCAASFTRLDDPNLLMWGSGSECVGPTLHISAENSQTSKPRSRWWKAWTLLTAPLSIFWIGRAVSSAKSKKQRVRQPTNDLTRMIDWH